MIDLPAAWVWKNPELSQFATITPRMMPGWRLSQQWHPGWCQDDAKAQSVPLDWGRMMPGWFEQKKCRWSYSLYFLALVNSCVCVCVCFALIPEARFTLTLTKRGCTAKMQNSIWNNEWYVIAFIQFNYHLGFPAGSAETGQTPHCARTDINQEATVAE